MLSQFAKTAKGSSLEGDEDDEAFAALAVVDDEEVWEDVEDTEEAAVADDDSEALTHLIHQFRIATLLSSRKLPRMLVMMSVHLYSLTKTSTLVPLLYTRFVPYCFLCTI